MTLSTALAAKFIVGGSRVNIEDYPYQVSIIAYDYFICGGSIIDETHILTAAHCVSGPKPNKFTIRTGSSSWASGGQVVNVTALTIHPDFCVPVMLDNDIAIITLATNLTYGPGTAPIDLPSIENGGSSSRDLLAGADVVASGWGQTGAGEEDAGEITPLMLRAVTANVITQEQCAAAYKDYVIPIEDSMLCTGVPGIGKGPCHGDSGGPLVADGVLVGVVSWALECDVQGRPIVYSSVGYFRDWIAQVVGI
ncbi:trypsin-like serine protease [Aspergillus californicus]